MIAIVKCNKRLEGLVQDDGRVVISHEATKMGVTRRCLSDLVKAGQLTRVGRGLYMRPDTLEDEMYLLQLRFGKGIYSHETALYLHGLTELTPSRYSMVFPFGYNTGNAKEAGVITRSAVKRLHLMGQMTLDSPGGNRIKAFDAERTLCDIARSSRQTDPRLIGEAFRAYLRWKQKDLDKLLAYASHLDVDRRIRTYFEVLL